MNLILLANIIGIIGSALLVYAGYVKSKKKVLVLQCIQMSLCAVQNALTKGIPGVIINVISVIRNILCYKEKLGKIETGIIILVSFVLTIWFNNLGWIGLLPFIATTFFIIFMNTKDVAKFKLVIIFTCICWIVYDVSLLLYTSAIFEFLSIISNLIGIYRIKKDESSNKEENEVKEGEEQ